MNIRKYLKEIIRSAVENYDMDDKIVKVLDSIDMHEKVAKAVENAFDSMQLEDTITEILEEYLEEIVEEEVNDAVIDKISANF